MESGDRQPWAPVAFVTLPGDTPVVRMVSRDGVWRVEQIRVLRGGRRELVRLRVTRYGVFVGDVGSVEDLAALGVPLADLVDDDTGPSGTMHR